MKKADEFRIGLWSIIAIVALVFGIKYLKGQLHTSTNYYLLSSNVDGLAESSHVKLKGYNVGFVSSLDYDYESGQVLIKLNIDPDLQIPADSRAAIASDLLGTSNVVLRMGRSSQMFAPGDTIAGGGTVPTVIDNAGPILAAVSELLPRLDTLISGINGVIAESKMQETLLEINRISLQLHQTLATLNKALPNILEHADNAVANLDTVTANLKQVEVQQIIDHANATLDSVNLLLSNIQSTDGTMGRLINTTELHDELTQTLQDVDSLVNDIHQNPKRYINVKLFGK